MKKIFYLLVPIFLASCGGGSDNTPTLNDDFDRSSLLANIHDNIIIPAYQNLKNDLQELDTKNNDFINSQNQQNLSLLRQALIKTYKSWQYVEMFNMGKAYDISYSKMGNSYPCREDRVNSQISDSISNISSFSGLLLGATGFPAIGFMIYGNDSSTTIEKFTGNDGPKYKAYLNALVSNLVQNTDMVLNDLENSRSSYVNSTGTSQTSSLSITVNDFVFYCEKIIRTAKIGNSINWFGTLPPGSNIQAMPDQIESYYNSSICKSLLINSIQSAKMMYTGDHYDGQTDGIGFRDYLSYLNNAENLISTIDNQFNDLENKVSLLDDDFAQELATGTDRMEDAFLSLQNLVTYFKSDMMTDRFGISPDYADNDGDGG
jgi:predicted lipoprotein